MRATNAFLNRAKKNMQHSTNREFVAWTYNSEIGISLGRFRKGFCLQLSCTIIQIHGVPGGGYADFLGRRGTHRWGKQLVGDWTPQMYIQETALVGSSPQSCLCKCITGRIEDRLHLPSSLVSRSGGAGGDVYLKNAHNLSGETYSLNSKV